MKLGFSSVACPTWDLPTLVTKAKAFGYQGIELRGLCGQMHLPLCAELAADPAATRALFAEAGVELVCLCSSAAFHYRDPRRVAANQAEAREYVELAGKLGCRHVRVFAGEIPRALLGYESRDTVLQRVAAALRGLAAFAQRHRVTLLIENSGDFVDSQSLWYWVDAAASPAVRACWSQFAALTRGEPASLSLKRLGRLIGMVRMTDGVFARGGAVESIEPPGKGRCDVPLQVELLKGLAFDGYLMFDWPKLWHAGLADAERVLPDAQKYLRGLLDAKTVELTAYRNDKNAPRFRTGRPAEPQPV
ncbi:MAG: sugar phosphate isomerase/epimerase family protein [Phycisphaerae bacterium]